MAEELTIRRNDEQSGYEISWQGKVWDSVTFRQLLTCENPQILIEHMICRVERRIRVHRFVRALKYSESSAEARGTLRGSAQEKGE